MFKWPTIFLQSILIEKNNFLLTISKPTSLAYGHLHGYKTIRGHALLWESTPTVSPTTTFQQYNLHLNNVIKNVVIIDNEPDDISVEPLWVMVTLCGWISLCILFLSDSVTDLSVSMSVSASITLLISPSVLTCLYYTCTIIQVEPIQG